MVMDDMLFKLTDNVLEVLAGQICYLIRAFELLDAHNDGRFDDTAPLWLTEVLEELANLTTAYQLLL